VVKVWHNDCSNTTGLRYEEIPEYFYVGNGGTGIWKNAQGNLESDNQSLFIMNVTKPTLSYGYFFYGPTAVYDLPDTFPVSGLRNLSAQIELDNSNAEYVGVAAIALCDETLSPILMATCYDTLSIVEEQLIWQYYPRNRSILQSYYFNKAWQDYSMLDSESLGVVNMTWTAAYIPGQGMMGRISAWESGDTPSRLFVAESDVEPVRAIKYLGIIMGGYSEGSHPSLAPFRIHDIFLQYEIGDDIDTSPPLVTPPLDRVCILGQTANAITWRCADDHPYRYIVVDIFHPSEIWGVPLLIEEGIWDGEDITISIDCSIATTRGYRLILQDKAGFMITDRVDVQIIQHPLISSFIRYIDAHPEIFVIVSAVVVGFFLYLKGWRKAVRYRKERISLYQKQ